MFRLLLLLVMCGQASAQEEGERASASFYCFKYVPDLQQVFVQTGTKRFEEVQLSSANIRGPFSVLKTDGRINVHRRDTNEEGETIYPVIGSAKAGARGSVLVVLFPSAKDALLPYASLTLDRDMEKFPMGSYQIVNFSPYSIRGAIGEKLIGIRPGRVELLKPEGTPGEMMQVIFEYQDGTLWRPLTTTRWVFRKDLRTLTCAYLDPVDKRLKLRGIPERRTTEEASP